MKAHGQFTPPVAYTEEIFGANPVQARHVGNDVIEYAGNIFRVAVWEPAGTPFGLGWDVDYNGATYRGTEQLSATSEVFHPDVCLVTGNGRVFAIVVFYYNGRWWCDAFYWNSNSFTLTNTFLLDGGNFGTTINIDGNDIGEFVIVWDNGGRVCVLSGDVASGVPNIHQGSPYQLTNGKSPDVSIYYDGTADTAHVVYLNIFTGDLEIRDIDIPAFASGSTNVGTNVFGVSHSVGYTFSRPRIASPNGSSGSVNELTVVVEHANPNSTPPDYQIVGYNNLNTTQIVYNNATQAPYFPLTNVPNYHVAVAYDSNYPSDGIWVGWTFDNLNNMALVPNAHINSAYPIVLKCDNTAVPVGSATYWEVADNIFGNGDYADCLALSGRYVTDELFLSYAKYYENMGTSADEVYYRIATNISSATSFRNQAGMHGSQAEVNLDSFIQDLPAEGNLETKIYDVQGRLVGQKISNVSEFRYRLAELIRQNMPGLYFVSVFSAERKQLFSGKLFYIAKQ
jgi:hypothetical protein